MDTDIDEDSEYTRFNARDVEIMNEKLFGFRGKTKPSLDIDDMVERINKRIAELEEEELHAKKAEKERKAKEDKKNE